MRATIIVVKLVKVNPSTPTIKFNSPKYLVSVSTGGPEVLLVEVVEDIGDKIVDVGCKPIVLDSCCVICGGALLIIIADELIRRQTKKIDNKRNKRLMRLRII